MSLASYQAPARDSKGRANLGGFGDLIKDNIPISFGETQTSFIALANELDRFRSERAHADRFATIADELELLDRYSLVSVIR